MMIALKMIAESTGALTTFSIANDIAKYFAIIPAIFMATYPGLSALNMSTADAGECKPIMLRADRPG
jgi:K+-transporting ATPase ATPase B chain